MAARGLDAIVLWGWPMMWDFYTANARYLSPIGGNAEFNVLIFPASGEPTSIVQMPTFLDGWRAAQDWVSDVRPRTKTWADSVANRLKELKLDGGKIGMDGLAGPLDPDGWLPHDVHIRTDRAAAAGASIVSLDDMLEKIRAIKSDEELGALRKAAELGDLMLATCRDVARPGVKECEVYGGMVQAMMANGGEEPTLFLWACDRYPVSASVPRADHAADGEGRPHHLRDAPEDRRLLHPCRAHLLPRRAGGRSSSKSTKAASPPISKGMEDFGPGKTISTAMDGGEGRDRRRAGLRICEAGIHGHGLASLEYPRYRHHAIAADREAIKVVGDRFEPGMVFAFNIDLFDPKWQDGKTGCVFAETVEITASGARRMHTFSTDFQKLPV